MKMLETALIESFAKAKDRGVRINEVIAFNFNGEKMIVAPDRMFRLGKMEK